MATLEEIALEVARSRERLHQLESNIHGLRLLMAELDANVTRKLDTIARADEIAQHVATELRKRGPAIPLRLFPKVVAGLVALVALAGGIKGLIG